MQKKIFMNLILVSLCGIILMTVALFVIQTVMIHNSADATIGLRLENVEEHIRQNELQIEKLTEAAKEDYISRARALAMIIEIDPSIIESRSRLEKAAIALNADEAHITDENGILRWGTQPQYYGLDFSTTDQTRPFLAILQDPSVEVAQDPMPNGSEGLMRQYAGVSMRHTKGIVQVGMVPERLEEALENNRLSNVLNDIAVANTGYVFAISNDTGNIYSHHNQSLIGESPGQLGNSGSLVIDGQTVRYGTRNIGDQTLVAVIPTHELYDRRTFYVVVFLAYVVALFSAFIWIIDAYVKRSVTNNISEIVSTLDRMSGGDLDVTVDVRSSEEFERLSDGINNMIDSIKAKMLEVAEMTDDLRQLGAIAAIADAGIIVKDKHGIVRKWNIGAQSLLGYEEDEIIEESTKYYAPPEAHAGIDEIERRLNNGEHIAHVEVVRKHKNGSLIDCSASYTPIFDDNNEFTGSVAIFHDISDKKRIEYELKEAVLAAEQANSAKSSFLANMSHEIRTPMNGIIGFSELALDDIGDIKKTKDYFDKIKASAEGLLQIINDILDISKIEAGKMELEKIPFNLHDVFKMCEAICEPKAAEKDISLYFYAEPIITKKLFGDPIKLRQVLLNLLTNAIKFTHKGMVKLTADIERPNGHNVTIRFEVTDSGIGMSTEQIQKSFEPFVQADSSTTRKYGGTGLGLAITKNIVELMGGELHVESVVGIGSKFSFSVPFEITGLIGNESGNEENRNREMPVFAGDVLVCEDNSINQQVIQGHLARLGLNVTIAENGKLGVEAVKNRTEKPFDLILMDIHMPVMDGVEASEKLIEMGNTTPIIALTANVMPKNAEGHPLNCMSDYILKPFTAQDLWTCLLRYLTPVGKTDIEEVKNESFASKELLIDRQSGMQNVCNDEELYNSILARFVKDNKTAVQQINQAVQEGDVTLAHRIAHTLKSVSGMIGAESLREAAFEVECALSGNGTVPADKMEALDNTLNAVLSELAAATQEKGTSARDTDTAETGRVDKEKATELISGLVPLLKEYNAQSLSYIPEIKEILSPAGEKADTLIRQIENYDFEYALKTVDSIKKEMMD